MMVIFISQCEKKALIRTRRILDAFANRIGERTWQTVITEEGLITVKKLLRQTVTKNTAVACHWMRSRIRNELLWIVGAKDKFNAQGIVPVNSTNKELKMDTPSDKPLPGVLLYANTSFQLLIEHLFAVGYVAEQLHKHLMPTQEKQIMATFIAGCLHDLGKIDPQFQLWVTNPKKKKFDLEDGQHINDAKFNFDKHPRHNEISVLLYRFLDSLSLKCVNPKNKEAIKHAIYWHHAKPFRKEKGFETYKDIYSKLTNHLNGDTFENLLQKAIHVLKKVCSIDEKYRKIESSVLAKSFDEKYDIDIIEMLGDICIPSFKNYRVQEAIYRYQTEVKDNASNNIMRACVISADRLISALTSEELHNKIKNNELDVLVEDVLLIESTLVSCIEEYLKKFQMGERTSKQSEVAQQLANAQCIAVLTGAAGCGKTKIALEWAKLKQAQQIFWVCPRVQVCQGLFYELTSEQYLPNVTIEINTGEFKFINQWDRPTPENQYFSGDIVITTIDQILNTIITHNKVDKLIDFLNVHVVFDEFHEYVYMPAFNLFFAELVACKQAREQLANTLLVSATPHYFYLREILGIHPDDVINMPSFNQSLYKIDFKIFDETKQNETNPLYQSQKKNTIVISNTALTAQKSFIHNQHRENSVLLHSKFKKSDKKKWFGEVYDSFKKNGTQKFDILRSGPIVQASLNISCDHMVAEIASAEDWLQRLGRLDRFGLNKTISKYCIAVPEPIHQNKGTGASARFLSRKYMFGSTKAWYQMLQGALDNEPVTLSQLYALYKKFYQSDSARKLIESDLVGSLKASVNLINQKVHDPIRILSKKTGEKGRIKISKSSLRGDNRFVQMAMCDVSDPSQPKFIDEYAYQILGNDTDEIDNLTASCDIIRGYEDSSKSPLAYMMKKHHQIMGGIKAYKDFILLNEARDPEFPIYLSYTPSDLHQIGGENARHDEAIYYAVCEKQPIGAILIKQLISDEE